MAESDEKKIVQDIAETAKKLQIEEIEWKRPASQSDIEYLLDHYPFLQIIDTSDEPNILPDVKIITAESGWNILYYGDAMSTSLGFLLFGGGDFRIKDAQTLKSGQSSKKEEDDGSAGGTIMNPGKGTFRNQAFMTAKEMVEIAKRMGWKGIRIIDGHRMMKWAVWNVGKDQSISVYGFEPDQKDQDKSKRLKRSRAELEIITGYVPRM